ncbi:MAG: hypothetical protein AAF716_17445 [Cyanobacteria bacterium P01_D01_bin.1]
MRSHTLLPTLGLLCILSACASPSPSPAPDTLSGDRPTSTVTDTAKTCNLSSGPLEPMAAPEMTPVYEQFNFRPEKIAIDTDTVTFKTPYYNFTICKGDRTWSITSAENQAAGSDAEFDYEQMLANLANPDYSAINIGDETYEYRVRLQADWLQEQLASAGEPPFSPGVDASESTEEAVYFELKLPDGELVSEQLYDLTDLQTAQLGISLGDPEIAGTVVIDDQLWLAATASQGEGSSGFASLIRYDLDTNELSVEQPAEMQGNQITAIAATNNNNPTLWLGTQRSGEGNPHLPADGLVAYQPDTQSLTTYSVTNSPLVGAIPFEVEAEADSLWVATGEGVCQVEWKIVDSDQSWDCWQFSATAELPTAGADLYPSFLSTESVSTLNQDSVEVLWAGETFAEESGEPSVMRYEVAYKPGFEVQIPQGGYWLTNEVARRTTSRTTKGEDIFWPGHAWHWRGDRFTRSLDEVALNMVGGGPHGLAVSNAQDGFHFDSNAIRGDFDLLDITPASTRVRHYSGWVEGTDLSVYPTVVSVSALGESQPNPLIGMAEGLPDSPGP